jgi:hypothetical protein
MIKVVGFYTKDTVYEEEANKLIKTLDTFSIPYYLYPIENKGQWVLNCAQKPKIIKQALDEFIDDILYLDVDARVLRRPDFEQLELSCPGYCVWKNPYTKNPEELASGTIYFPNNKISRAVLDDWISMQEKYPKMWDQKVLETLYKKYPYELLHHDWINIAENSNKGLKFIETENPIILHTQASRRLRQKI